MICSQCCGLAIWKRLNLSTDLYASEFTGRSVRAWLVLCVLKVHNSLESTARAPQSPFTMAFQQAGCDFLILQLVQKGKKIIQQGLWRLTFKVIPQEVNSYIHWECMLLKKTCACISKDFALNLSSNSNLHKLLKTLQYCCFQKFKASPKPKFKETRLHSLMVATVVMSQNGVSTGVGRITVAAYANRLAESKLKV